MNNPSVWILSQKFSKSYYFEYKKVRRSDIQSSTDLCVTVQLYTQVSACCWLGWLGWFMGGDKTRQDKKQLGRIRGFLSHS